MIKMLGAPANNESHERGLSLESSKAQLPFLKDTWVKSPQNRDQSAFELGRTSKLVEMNKSNSKLAKKELMEQYKSNEQRRTIQGMYNTLEHSLNHIINN